MALLEPIVIVFGSSKTISSVNLRLPISFRFAVDEALLECMVTGDPQSFDTCSQQYFIILLDLISNDFFNHLQTNNRVQAIYSHNTYRNASNQLKLHRIINKQWEQFIFDLTIDIVNFLTNEGKNQEKSEQLPLAQLYCRQARLLKDWAMSFIKAEPCHILLIPLNSSQENLENTYERIQQLCNKLGYPSTIIRTLDKYIPFNDVDKPCLIPYTQYLFENEHPHYICELIKRLSPLRFYLYGNEYNISSEWSNLMINREINLMDDEDNWCAFLENESIDNDMKWNFSSMFGEKWQIKRIAPINLDNLNENLRFQSALRRAFKTFHQRQIEITAEIFEWYDKCITNGHIQSEPKLTVHREAKFTRGEAVVVNTSLLDRHSVSILPHPAIKVKTNSFIWLDEHLRYSVDYLNEIITPSKWYFSDDISTCTSYIENQLHEENKIFLVVSNSFGQKLFLNFFHLISLIPFVYIYSSKIRSHNNWINDYPQIRGIYNDFIQLSEQIKQDLHEKQSSTNEFCIETNDESPNTSLSLIVYNQEHARLFLAVQRTIDTILCMPQTPESRDEMLIECRHICKNNEQALTEINTFDKMYESNAALQWYSRDTFLFRIVNKVLRSNNVNTMFNIRHFLTDLYTQLNELHKKENLFESYEIQQIKKVYRGQHISKIEFEYLQEIKGNIISINTFLSTTKSLQIALCFANTVLNNNNLIPVLFCIEINRSSESVRPYANISKYSMFQDEEEVLFSMGSIFRIQHIEILDKTDNIPVIYLTLIDHKELENI